MKIGFCDLFTVAIRHAYYDGLCSDFEFVILPATADVLRGGRLLARVVDGRLHVLFEIDPDTDPIDKTPIISLAGETLTFGLRLQNPRFINFTAPIVSDSKLVPFFTNGANARALDPPKGIAPSVFPYKPKSATRPLPVHLLNSQNTVLATEAVAAGVAEISFDLRRVPDGSYRIQEEGGDPPLELMVNAALRDAGVWGIVAVKINAGFYTAPAVLVLNFESRTEHLKYFVVADRFSEPDFLALKVKDAGFVDDKRPEVKFTTVKPAEFTKDDIPPSLLGDVSRVVMFRSVDRVARRASGLRKIQLTRTEDESGILIANLPLPAADRPQSHFIVHLSNPRGA